MSGRERGTEGGALCRNVFDWNDACRTAPGGPLELAECLQADALPGAAVRNIGGRTDAEREDVKRAGRRTLGALFFCCNEKSVECSRE